MYINITNFKMIYYDIEILNYRNITQYLHLFTGDLV